jgi:enoyl-CoA hydratase/carnithine racemase
MPDEPKLHEYRPASHVRQLVLDDAATRNALSLAMRGKLIAALEDAAAERDCRVVIITGTGKVFASGSDIRMLAASSVDEAVRPEVRRLWDTMLRFPKPVVIALNGHALGGGLELALCGDIILAARGIRLGQPEPKLGIMPGGGGTQRLVRALGHYRAARLLLTAEPIDAETAERWGLVAEICEPEALNERALAIAQAIAALAPNAMTAIKQALRDGADLPLADGLAVELDAFRRVFATADAREGLTAFLEKRPARFTGD